MYTSLFNMPGFTIMLIVSGSILVFGFLMDHFSDYEYLFPKLFYMAAVLILIFGFLIYPMQFKLHNKLFLLEQEAEEVKMRTRYQVNALDTDGNLLHSYELKYDEIQFVANNAIMIKLADGSWFVLPAGEYTYKEIVEDKDHE